MFCLEVYISSQNELLVLTEVLFLDRVYGVVCMGEERWVYGVLVGKLEGKRPMGRPRRRWVDNIRMSLQELGCGLVWPRIGTGGGRL